VRWFPHFRQRDGLDRADRGAQATAIALSRVHDHHPVVRNQRPKVTPLQADVAIGAQVRVHLGAKAALHDGRPQSIVDHTSEHG
jgi:hypothetical protein